MTASSRSGLALLAIAVLLGAGAAEAGHGIQRGVSLKYEQKQDKFKGRIKSESPACLGGVVTVRKIKRRRPNPIVGSDLAGSNGRWKVKRSARRGRFYASTPRYETSEGLCRAVSSPVLRLR